MAAESKPTSSLAGRTITLLILQHLANAPRAQKEAAALARAGAVVSVRGCWWNRDLAAEDQEIARNGGYHVVPLADLSSRRGTLLLRLRARFARTLCRRWNIVRPEAFGLTARGMLQVVTRERPDLTMVHCEPGLWAGTRLLQRGLRVGVDFEDWFSEDLLPADRLERPVAAMARAEQTLLRNGAVQFATTSAMAGALQSWARSPRPPVTIPNSFPWSAAPSADDPGGDRRDPGTLSFYWFSQTIGPGRGLETLARALAQVKGDWTLHLRGNLGGYAAWYEEHFPAAVRQRTVILPGVSNRDLPRRSSGHDVGLALEIPFCRSRDLTATNKIFEYLRCGLPVIATTTSGQREVMQACPDAGWLVPPEDVSALARTLQTCVDDPTAIRKRRDEARQAARDTWAWEKFAPRLVAAVQEALNGPTPLPKS